LDNFDHLLTITTLAHVLIVFAIGIRVVMKRPAPGVAFAWLLLIVILPFAGALLYLLIGERRVGPERRHRIDALASLLGQPGGHMSRADLTDVDWSPFSAPAFPPVHLSRLTAFRRRRAG
jgi:cardiolipin synthase